MKALVPKFEGTDQNDAVVDSIMMVGAEFGDQNGLKPNDRSLLRIYLYVMQQFKIPTSPDLAQFGDMSLLGEAGKAPVEVVNGDKKHGGRNFFYEEHGTRGMVLCNIPTGGSISPDELLNSQNTDLMVEQLNLLMDAFQNCSSYHHDTFDWFNWRHKIDQLAPDFVLISGDDSFEPKDLVGDRYVLLASDKFLGKGLMVSKKYLRDMKPYLESVNSPLAQCVPIDGSKTFKVAFNPSYDGEPNVSIRAVANPSYIAPTQKLLPSQTSNKGLVTRELHREMREDLIEKGVDRTRVDEYWAAVNAYQNEGIGNHAPMLGDYTKPLDPDVTPKPFDPFGKVA